MSREDVPIIANPDHHHWVRVGPTRDHLDPAGMNWPTCPAICEWCREYRPDVAVSLLEGTAGDMPVGYWPGYCNVSTPEPWRAKPPVDTAWLRATDSGVRPAGGLSRGVLNAVSSALVWGALTSFAVLVFDLPWMWVPAFVAFGLGAGLFAMTTEKKPPKGPKKGKG